MEPTKEFRGFCPLSSMSARTFSPCIGDACAWYCINECALVALNSNLADIVPVISEINEQE